MSSTLTMTETDVAPAIDFPHLTFTGGLPGFPDARKFVLLNTDLAQAPFSIMRCIEEPELEFVVTTPSLFFPSYAPDIDDATVQRTGLESSDDALLLVILTVGEEAIDVTANLLGPIVVNQKTNSAAQAILTGQDFDIRQPLFNEELRSVVSE